MSEITRSPDGHSPSEDDAAAVADHPIRVCCLCLARYGLLRYCVALVRALSICEGLRVTVIAPKEEEAYLAGALRDVLERSSDAVEVHYVQMSGAANRLLLPFRVIRLVILCRPQVIHDPVGIAFTLGFAVWPALRALAPLVVTFHDPRPHSGMGRTLWSRFRRLAIRTIPNAIVVHGTANAREAVACGVPSERVVVSQHMLLDQFQSHDGPPEEPVTALFFGQLRPNKGMELLGPIVDRVVRELPEFRLIVAGKVPDGHEFRRSGWTVRVTKILERLKALEHVEVHDRFISDEDTKTLFSRAALVILPYTDGSQSGVLLLAMARRKPVVATDVGEIGVAVRHYGGGVLADYDTDAFAEAIVSALRNSGSLKDAIRQREREVETQYGADSVARGLMGAYRSLERRPD